MSFDGGSTWYAPDNSGNLAEPDSVTYDSSTGEYTSVWNFKITDNGDGDDSTQVGKNYTISYNIYNSSRTLSSVSMGAATTGVTAVPEFGTIAIPVAIALLAGLFFMRRQ